MVSTMLYTAGITCVREQTSCWALVKSFAPSLPANAEKTLQSKASDLPKVMRQSDSTPVFSMQASMVCATMLSMLAGAQMGDDSGGKGRA